jgi:hypothetical protein
MSNTIISNEEYRELMRKQMMLTFKVMFWIFLIMGILLAFGGVAMLVIENDEEWIAMMVPAGIMIVVSVVSGIAILNYKNKPFSNYAYEQYVAYETTGTKVPLYRVVSNGKSSQTIYMLLDIVDGTFKLFDIKRNKLKLYFEGKESDIRVKFFYKTKHGLDMIKTKVQFFVNEKKYNVFGMAEVNDLFLTFLKNEGLQYQVQLGREKRM